LGASNATPYYMSLTQRIALTKLQAWERIRPTVKSGPLTIPAYAEAAQLIYREADWKTEIIDRLLKVCDGAFVDIGTNIGQTLVDYAEATRQNGYIGFEPSPRCVEIVTAIINANTLPDVALIPIGLSDRATVVPFFVRTGLAADTTATMVKEIRPDDPVDTIYVPVFPFDDIYRDTLKARQLALIKIDVEGGELQVLNGMRKTMLATGVPIICEVLHRDIHADAQEHSARCHKIMQIVHEVGYKAYRMIKSQDDKCVISFCEVSTFPDEVYSPNTMNQCDYLLSPNGSLIERI
jgi:FkbM family methyltransferase